MCMLCVCGGGGGCLCVNKHLSFAIKIYKTVSMTLCITRQCLKERYNINSFKQDLNYKPKLNKVK